MKLLFNLLTIALVTFLSCSTDEPVTDPENPENLVVNVLNSDDGSGIVMFSATAEKAVAYELRSGEAASTTVTNTTGTFEYTYKESGIYTFDIRAFGSNGRFLKHVEQIVVELGTEDTATPGYTTPLSYPDMDLVWSDEFNGDRINTDDWSFEIGTGCPDLCGWGNNELQYYQPDNSRVANGLLTIEAREQLVESSNYTSTRMITRDKQSFLYGRVDIRARLPKGQGIWPALWMLGQNITSVGWPRCGEIDIMEMIGGSGRERQSHGNLYWDQNGPRDNPKTYTLSSGRFYDEFHVFSITWDEEEIKWFVDDEEFHVVNITDDTKSAFHKPFFFIFNIAVGGNWPGSPDNTTVFPTQMDVDYIRVFQFK